LSIPELLESVLGHVGRKDVLNVRQVSHGLRAIVEASPKLRVKLHYRPADVTRFKVPYYTTPFDDRLSTNPTWFYVCEEYLADGLALLHASASMSDLPVDHDVPYVGDTWKRMLICQLPVYKMSVRLSSSKHSPDFPIGTAIVSETGITVGDLYGEAARILGEQTKDDFCACGHRLSGFDHWREGLVEMNLLA
jgi:hypothetical protein